MHRALKALGIFFLAGGAGTAAWGGVFSGNVFRVSTIWVGGGAVGVSSDTFRLVASVGQTAVDMGTTTASFFLRPGFLQDVAAPPGGGGGVGGVDPERTNHLRFTTIFGCLDVTVPAGCFGAPVSLTVSTPSFVPSAVSHIASLKGTPVAVSLAVNPALSPKKAIAVTACYRAQDVQGRDEKRLRLAVLLPGDEAWLPLASSADTSRNQVSAAAARLGLWRLVEVLPSESVGGALAFPNPLLPGQGAMSFSNLPPGARLRLYTFSGRPVRELAADDTGRASWEGLNDGGEPVASGTYFVYIDGDGGKRTMKVQVQR